MNLVKNLVILDYILFYGVDIQVVQRENALVFVFTIWRFIVDFKYL